MALIPGVIYLMRLFLDAIGFIPVQVRDARPHAPGPPSCSLIETVECEPEAVSVSLFVETLPLLSFTFLSFPFLLLLSSFLSLFPFFLPSSPFMLESPSRFSFSKTNLFTCTCLSLGFSTCELQLFPLDFASGDGFIFHVILITAALAWISSVIVAGFYLLVTAPLPLHCTCVNIGS